MQRDGVTIREQLIRVPVPLQPGQVLQLPRCVPHRRPLVTMRKVHVDFEVVEAARLLEIGTHRSHPLVDRLVQGRVGVVVIEAPAQKFVSTFEQDTGKIECGRPYVNVLIARYGYAVSES